MFEKYATESLKLLVFIAIALNFTHPKQSKVAGMSVGMVLLCAIMLPFVDIIDKTDWKISNFTKPEIGETENFEVMEKVFEDAVATYISEFYGIDRSDVKVMADGFDIELMRAERIYVTLSGKALTLDYRSLETKIESEFTDEGRCEVEFDIR